MQGILKRPNIRNLKIIVANCMYREPNNMIKFCVSNLKSLYLLFNGSNVSSLNWKTYGKKSSVGQTSKVARSISPLFTNYMLPGKSRASKGKYT